MLAFTKPKIISLDDDQSLLDVIQYYFTEQFKNTVQVKTFSKSMDFFSHLEKHCYLPDSASEIINSFYENNINKEQIIKTLQDLRDLSAIIILDQELRDEAITGIDISARVRAYYPSSYICMLTSNVPNSKAVQLHNNHNIDLFVDKKDELAIHNLYNYLAMHIDRLNNHYAPDSVDIFSETKHLDNNTYILSKKDFLTDKNPSAFLTLNPNGDIALIQEDEQISFWQYLSEKQDFVAYEYE